MIQRVQLLSKAVVFIDLDLKSLSNQKDTSLFIEPIESLPCTAFFVASVPN